MCIQLCDKLDKLFPKENHVRINDYDKVRSLMFSGLNVLKRRKLSKNLNEGRKMRSRSERE